MDEDLAELELEELGWAGLEETVVSHEWDVAKAVVLEESLMPFGHGKSDGVGVGGGAGGFGSGKGVVGAGGGKGGGSRDGVGSGFWTQRRRCRILEGEKVG